MISKAFQCSLALLIFILVVHKASPMMTTTDSQKATPPPQLLIVLQFNNSENVSQVEQVVIYNNTLNPNFFINSFIFNCDNPNAFIINLEYLINDQYEWIIQKYSSPLNVSIDSKYNDESGPSSAFVLCNFENASECVIPVKTNCGEVYSSNIVEGTVTTLSGNLITEFEYNSVCNSSKYEKSSFQLGTLAIVIFSIFFVFISAQLQFLTTYPNWVLFINYYIIGIYCVLVIIKNLLIMFDVPHIIQAINWFCILGSVILGVVSSMICFSQLAYLTKLRFFRWSYGKKLKLRVMDVLGFLFGIGIICAWFFSGSNWVVSDVIFAFIYVSFIKLVKIGSLRLIVLIYILTIAIAAIFLKTFSEMNNQFTNQRFNIFNNPLFFIFPIIAHIPNRKCIWYFFMSMCYPGMFLAYLQRFDKNRSSKVYSIIFMICFVLCSLVWFIATLVVALPYDLFTVPVTTFVLVIIANRRDDLRNLWSGEFYDEQNKFFNDERAMNEKFDNQKSISYNESMFNSLKYRQMTSRSESVGGHLSKNNQNVSPVSPEAEKKYIESLLNSMSQSNKHGIFDQSLGQAPSINMQIEIEKIVENQPNTQ